MIGQQGGDQILQPRARIARCVVTSTLPMRSWIACASGWQKAEAELTEMSKQIQKHNEERKAAQAQRQQVQDQAVEQALNDLKGKHQAELSKLEEARVQLQQERDAAIKDRDDVERELETMHARQARTTAPARATSRRWLRCRASAISSSRGSLRWKASCRARLRRWRKPRRKPRRRPRPPQPLLQRMPPAAKRSPSSRRSRRRRTMASPMR